MTEHVYSHDMYDKSYDMYVNKQSSALHHAGAACICSWYCGIYNLTTRSNSSGGTHYHLQVVCMYGTGGMVLVPYCTIQAHWLLRVTILVAPVQNSTYIPTFVRRESHGILCSFVLKHFLRISYSDIGLFKRRRRRRRRRRYK